MSQKKKEQKKDFFDQEENKRLKKISNNMEVQYTTTLSSSSSTTTTPTINNNETIKEKNEVLKDTDAHISISSDGKDIEVHTGKDLRLLLCEEEEEDADGEDESQTTQTTQTRFDTKKPNKKRLKTITQSIEMQKQNQHKKKSHTDDDFGNPTDDKIIKLIAYPYNSTVDEQQQEQQQQTDPRILISSNGKDIEVHHTRNEEENLITIIEKKNSSLISTLPNELLKECLSFIGDGDFIFIARVSKSFKLNYTELFPLQRTTAKASASRSLECAKFCFLNAPKSFQNELFRESASEVEEHRDILEYAIDNDFITDAIFYEPVQNDGWGGIELNPRGLTLNVMKLMKRKNLGINWSFCNILPSI